MNVKYNEQDERIRDPRESLALQVQDDFTDGWKVLGPRTTLWVLRHIITNAGTGKNWHQKWMADCRIASPKIHKELSMKRMLGASTETTESDDATGITVTPGNALFYIKYDPQFIKVGQLLTIACTNGKLKQQPKRISVHLPHESGMSKSRD